MSRMVREMLRDDVIKESASPWASLVVLRVEKDRSLCFCVDYRRLNAVTYKTPFPLPRIDDLLDQMQGKKVFFTLDANRGYWQTKVQEATREKTASRCLMGSMIHSHALWALQCPRHLSEVDAEDTLWLQLFFLILITS